MNISNKPTKEELRDMLEKGMSLYQISRLYNTTIPIIFQLEIEYGINSWSYNLKYNMTKEDLGSMYIDEHMTQQQIAKELGCSRSHVRVMMYDYHILARGSGKYTAHHRSLKDDDIVQMHNCEINEIARMYINGNTQEEIAKKIGCSIYRVRRVLKKHGISARESGRFTAHQRSLLYNEIEQKYKDGKTMCEIAEEFDYTQVNVSRILKERGVLTRGSNGIINHQKLSLITANNLQECIDKGMNQAQIAEYFNVSDATIFNLAEKFNISGMVDNYRCTTPEYLKWRRKVLERDHYTCQICGKIGGRLEVHHIFRWVDAPEIRYNVDNGVPLCHECHQKVTGHEYEYAQQFLDITQPQYRDHNIIESMPWEPPLELHSIIDYPEEKGVINHE